MGAQVLKSTFIFSALVFALVWSGLALSFYKMENFHVVFAHFQATYQVEARGLPEHLIRFRHPQEGWIERPASSIYVDEEIKNLVDTYEQKATDFAWLAAIPTILAALVAMVIFFLSGKDMEGDTHVRGTRLITHKELKRWTEDKWRDYRRRFGKDRKKGPQYKIADIKFPPNAIEAQTAICGTVGTGKSNAIRELLTTIRENDGKAIIYDRMGTFVENFYDPDRDIIINPFDRRSHAWSPFYEAENKHFFTQLAEVLIPDKPHSNDPFWSQAARIIFDYASREIFELGDPSNKALRRAILNIPSSKLAELISRTPGSHFFNDEIIKTAQSIRANLITELRFLEFLRDDAEPFSIREWIKNDNKKGFVFLTGDAEHAAATRNIISCIFEVAANSLMTSGQADEPKVWFFMDEVPTLNRLPFLPKSLAEIRQFGGAFVIGYQVYSQLEAIYGDKDAQTISGNLNNKIIFNTPDARTAELFSQSLGSEDIEESRQNITVGAHQSRDGVGFMSNRIERRIVTASQIQSLPQFEGYVGFAYDSPVAFVIFKPFPTNKLANAFEPYGGHDFGRGDLEAAFAKEHEDDDPEENAQKIVMQRESTQDEFDAYLERLKNAGLDQYLGDDLEWAKEHFIRERTKGINPNDIAPPPYNFHMMAGAGQKPTSSPAAVPKVESSSGDADESNEKKIKSEPEPQPENKKSRFETLSAFEAAWGTNA
jgi:type IV conjugative transfer system coupling protein TraD